MQFKSTIALLLLVSAVMGLRILPWGEPILTYPNTGMIQTIDLFFTLEQNIPAGHYLRVFTPFAMLPAIGSATLWVGSTNRGSIAITAPAAAQQTGCTVNIIPQVQVSTPLVGTSSYFGCGALSANTPYQLRIAVANITDPAGFAGWLQLETLSPYDPTSGEGGITIDVNNAFAPIHILPYARGTGTLTGTLVTANDPNAVLANATYLMDLKVTPANTFWYGPLFRFFADNTQGAFKLGLTGTTTGVSSIDGGQLATGASVLTSDKFSVVVATNCLDIYQNTPVLASRSVTYRVPIVNPPNIGTTTLLSSISVAILHRWNLNISEYIDGPGLSVSASSPVYTYPCVIKNNKLLLSWGLDRGSAGDSTALFNRLFRIIVSDDTNAVYQTIKYSFSVNQTATGSQTFTLTFCSTAAHCSILANSIIATTSASGSTMACALSATSNGVTCTTSTLSSTATYTIAARVRYISSAVAFTATGTNLQKTGTISGFSLTSSCTDQSLISYYLQAIDTSISLNPTMLMNTFGNGAQVALPSASSTWTSFKSANPYSSSSTVGDTVAAIGSTSATTNYNLAFVTSIDIATTPSAFSVTGGNQDALNGIDVYLNPNLWQVSSSTTKACSFVNDPSVAATITSAATSPNGLHCSATQITSSNNGFFTYTRVRAVSTAANAWGIATNSGANQYFTPIFEQFVSNVNAYAGHSIKADGNVNEYYIATYKISALPAAIASITSGIATSTTELGEFYWNTTAISTATMNITGTVGHVYFGVSYILNPSTVAASRSSGTSGIKVWLSGYYTTDSNTVTAANALLQIRVRGAIAAGEYNLTSAKLGLFFKGGKFTPLLAASTTLRCIINGVLSTSGCVAERAASFLAAFSNKGSSSAQNMVSGFVNSGAQYHTLDQYAIYTVAQSNSLTTSFSASIFLAPTSQTDTNVYFRIAQISGTNYALPAYDLALSNNLGTALSATGTSVNQAAQCAYTNPVTGVYPVGIRLQPGTNDVVLGSYNTQLSINPSVAVTPSLKYGTFVYCSQYPWTSGASISATSFNDTATSDTCAIFDYTADGVTGSYYCITCPISSTITVSTGATATTSITVTAVKAASSIDLQFNHYYISTDDTGKFVERGSCSSTTGSQYYKAGTLQAPSSVTVMIATLGQKVVVSYTMINPALTNLPINRLVLQGYQQAAATATDSSFPYGSLDSLTSAWFYPNGLSGTIAAWTPATLSTATGQLIATFSSFASSTTARGAAWSASGSYTLLIWGFNGSPTATATQSYYAVQTYNGAGSNTLIDQSTTAGLWNVTAALGIFNIYQPLYQRPYVNGRGYFKFDFSVPSARPIYYKDKITFNLDAVSSGTVNNDSSILRCRVTDTSDNVVFAFKACTISNTGSATKIDLSPLQQANSYELPNTTYRVYLDNTLTLAVASQSTKYIYGNLRFAGLLANAASDSLVKSVTNLTGDAVNTLSALAAFSPGVSVKHHLRFNSEQQDLWFTINSTSPINDTCRISITFPSAYNPGLNTRGALPFCSIDALPVYCYIPDNLRTRTLHVDNFPVAKAANTSFILKVSGISAPSSTYKIAVDQFWLQINQDKTDAAATATSPIVTAGGILTETNPTWPTSTITGLNVIYHNLATTATRTMATWQWNVFVGAQIAVSQSNTSFQLIFPDSWGIAWGNAASPSCKAYDYYNSALSYAAGTAPLGNQFQLNLTASIAASTIVILECSGIRTADADSASYPTQDVQIKIIDANATTILYRSAPQVHNVNYALQLSKPSGLTTLSWALGSSLVVKRGTYTLPLTLNIPNQSSKIFTVTASSANFAFYPAVLNVPYGVSTVAALLGVSSAVYANNYQVYFTLSDSSAYSGPNALTIAVTTDKVVLSPTPSSDITLAAASGVVVSSVPIVFDLSSYRPYADVTITAQFDTINSVANGQANTNFTVVVAGTTSGSSLALTPANPVGAFVFKTTSATVIPTATSTAAGAVKVTYVLSGTNAGSYAIPNIQNVIATAASSDAVAAVPTLTAAVDQSTGTATTKGVAFTLGGVDSATIYYVVALVGATPTSQDAVIGGASANRPVFSPLAAGNPGQVQFGLPVTLSKGSQTVSLGGLLPSQNYEIRAYAVSPFGKNSTQAYTAWSQSSNGGSVTKVFFNFTTYPTSAQRQVLFCTLASTLKIQAQLIVGINGDCCGNTSTFYNGTNTTGVLSVFFYPQVLDVETVVIPTVLVNALSSPNNVSINNAINTQGGVGYLNVATDTTVKNTQPTSAWGSASVGTTWISITGALNDTGYVFAAVDSNSSATPSIGALKWNINTTFIGWQSTYYTVGSAGASLNFTGLSANTLYKLYVIGSNNDPSISANFTGTSSTVPSVTSFSVQTAAAGTTATVNAVSLATTLLVALLSILSLLMI